MRNETGEILEKTQKQYFILNISIYGHGFVHKFLVHDVAPLYVDTLIFLLLRCIKLLFCFLLLLGALGTLYAQLHRFSDRVTLESLGFTPIDSLTKQQRAPLLLFSCGSTKVNHPVPWLLH